MVSEEYLKILVVEDNDGDFLLISDYLSEKLPNARVNHVTRFSDVRPLLEHEGHPAVILLDLSLPDHSGENLVLDMISLAEGAIVIVLTGYSDRAFGIKTLSKGVYDYLLKDELDAAQLYKSISYSIERKKIATQLRQNLERYEAISKATSDAVWDYDYSIGRTYIAGSGYRNLFGYDIENAFTDDRFWEERIHPDDKKEVLMKLEAAIGDPSVTHDNYEYRFRKADGTYAYVNDRFFIIRENGVVKRMLGAKQDITRVKEEQKEKERMIQELLSKNADLRQFSYITSHNLRGPVANLLGLSGLLDHHQITDPEVQQILNGIKRATAMLDETIRDLNTVLHCKDNRALPREEILLEQVHLKTLSQCEGMIQQTDAFITATFEAPIVKFNKAYLESIFINLITNSIKYRAPERTPKIHVHSESAPDHVRIIFSDNGLGIDTERFGDRVFRLYQRFHTHAEGRGLGLFLVKSQVEAMDGTIELTSTVGEGSRFVITFPHTALN